MLKTLLRRSPLLKNVTTFHFHKLCQVTDKSLTWQSLWKWNIVTFFDKGTLFDKGVFNLMEYVEMRVQLIPSSSSFKKQALIWLCICRYTYFLFAFSHSVREFTVPVCWTRSDFSYSQLIFFVSTFSVKIAFVSTSFISSYSIFVSSYLIWRGIFLYGTIGMWLIFWNVF